MSANRGHQKQLAKQKKKRELARKAVRSTASVSTSAPGALLRLAPTLPFGPAFMSASWRSDDEDTPDLVSVVITRILPDAQLLPAIVLVDRTCLGVKSAFAARPMTRFELDSQLRGMGDLHAEGMEETTVLEAQSVIYHAIDFARSLGFEPDRDFPQPVVGARPDVLLETPLAHPERPTYIAGPDDDAAAVLARLAQAAEAQKGAREPARELRGRAAPQLPASSPEL